jgi:hypothetical protein
MAFSSQAEAAIDVCFENILSEGRNFLDDVDVGHSIGLFRTVELDVDIGSSAFDYEALQQAEVRPLVFLV